MKCPVCGNEIEENAQFCSNCGTAVVRESFVYEEQKTEEQNANQTFQQDTAGSETASQSNAYEEKKEESKSTNYSQTKTAEPVVPEAYKPLSMWAYFGYDILFAIPIVGFICVLIFAFGTEKNKNLINFAQSRFLWVLARIVIFTFMMAVAIAYFLFS